MKALLLLLVLIVACVIGVGLYLGWFSLSAGSADGKTSVALTVDQSKIGEDARKAQEKVQELGRDATDKAAATMEKTPERN